MAHSSSCSPSSSAAASPISSWSSSSYRDSNNVTPLSSAAGSSAALASMAMSTMRSPDGKDRDELGLDGLGVDPGVDSDGGYVIGATIKGGKYGTLRPRDGMANGNGRQRSAPGSPTPSWATAAWGADAFGAGGGRDVEASTSKGVNGASSSSSSRLDGMGLGARIEEVLSDEEEHRHPSASPSGTNLPSLSRGSPSHSSSDSAAPALPKSPPQIDSDLEGMSDEEIRNAFGPSSGRPRPKTWSSATPRLVFPSVINGSSDVHHNDDERDDSSLLRPQSRQMYNHTPRTTSSATLPNLPENRSPSNAEMLYGTHRRHSRVTSVATAYGPDGQPSSTTTSQSHSNQSWTSSAGRSWRYSLPPDFSAGGYLSGGSSRNNSPQLSQGGWGSGGSASGSAGPSPVVVQQGHSSSPRMGGSAPNTRPPSRKGSSASLGASPMSRDGSNQSSSSSGKFGIGLGFGALAGFLPGSGGGGGAPSNRSSSGRTTPTEHGGTSPRLRNGFHSSPSSPPPPPRSRHHSTQSMFVPFPSSPAQNESHESGRTIPRGATNGQKRNVRSSMPGFPTPPERSSSRAHSKSPNAAAAAFFTPSPTTPSSSGSASAAGSAAAGSSGGSSSRRRTAFAGQFAQQQAPLRTSSLRTPQSPKSSSGASSSTSGREHRRPRPQSSAGSFASPTGRQEEFGPRPESTRTWSTFGQGRPASFHAEFHPRNNASAAASSSAAPANASSLNANSHLIIPPNPITALHDFSNSTLALSARRYAHQLTVPLKPLAHVAVFVTISTAAVLAFVAVLMVSYGLTAFDDLEKRAKHFGGAAHGARQSALQRVEWGRKALGQVKENTVDVVGNAVSMGIHAVADRTAVVRDVVLDLAAPVLRQRSSKAILDAHVKGEGQSAPVSGAKKVRRKKKRRAGVPSRRSRPNTATANPELNGSAYNSDADEPAFDADGTMRSRWAAGGKGKKRASPERSRERSRHASDASSAADDEDDETDSENESKCDTSGPLPRFGFAFRAQPANSPFVSTTGSSCEASTSKAGAEEWDRRSTNGSAGALPSSEMPRPPWSILLPSIVAMVMLAGMRVAYGMAVKWVEYGSQSRVWRTGSFRAMVGKDKGKARAR